MKPSNASHPSPPAQPLNHRTQRIVIATGNPHKVRELGTMLALPGIEFVGLSQLASEQGRSWVEPAETGTTFGENAAIKAMSYAQQTGLPSLADDSGLEVDGLGGMPGVISSHYCSDGKEIGMSREQRDHANNEKLLTKLDGIGLSDRSARFVCVMTLAMPAQAMSETAGDRSEIQPRIVASVRGTFEGRIGLPGDGPGCVPAGENGFGYDPLFLVGPDFSRTSAQLSPQEKNRLSHRAKAAALMLDQLRAIVDA